MHTARRTQADRRAETRRALLDATTAALVDVGYTATSTTEVVRRAGLSQGALFKHFPTKASLMAATAAHLYEQLTATYLGRFRRLARHADDGDRAEAAVRLLWSMFEQPEFGAALELSAAARADEGLRRSLEPVVVEHGDRVRSVAGELFPDVADRDDFAVFLDLALEAMLGMAMSRAVDRRPAHYRRVVGHLAATARAIVTRPTADIPDIPARRRTP